MTALPLIEDFENPNYDPFAAEDMVFGDMTDMHERLKALRAKGSVLPGSFMSHMGFNWPSEPEAFTILAYKDVANTLTDYKKFTNQCFLGTLGKTFGRTLSAMDPPEHSQYRRLFQKVFLPQNIARWGDSIVDVVVKNLIGKFKAKGEADLIDDFTKVYPFEIIYHLLALPPGDGPIFHRLAVAQNMVYTKEGVEAAEKLGRYFERLVEARRKEPGEDLASVLITTTIDGEYLPDDVTISFLRQLINAAGDTTFRGTSVLLTGLLTNPDQLEALRSDRSLMTNAIDEALRWEPPVNWTERTSAEDTVIGGVKIPAGSTVIPVLAAANSDESVFKDGDKFDIFRKWDNVNSPIIFARGPHICVGQHLARLEITRAINALFENLPNLRLNPDKPPPEVQGAMLRHPKHIYVKFD